MPLSLHVASLCVLTSAASPALPYKSAQSFPAAAVARVMVTNWRGDVAVQGGDASEAHLVTRLVAGDKSRCEPTVRLEGDLLVVEASRGQSCQMDVELQVPMRVALESVTGAGDVRVRGTRGPVRVRTGSGDVHLEGVVTQLTASLGSGDLRASHLAGDATVRQGGGSSTLLCQGRGTIHLRVGAGDVDVILPRRTAAQQQLSVGAGEVHTLVPTAPDPAWVVRGSVGAGQVTIRALN